MIYPVESDLGLGEETLISCDISFHHVTTSIIKIETLYSIIRM